MKKIAVKGLILLREKEHETVSNMQYERDMISRGYSNYEKEFEKNRERLSEIRSEFEKLSAKLNEAINEAEGRATVRKIDVNDIINALVEVDNYFGITKKAMIGTTVEVDCNAQKFPNAYKWSPESTHFWAEMTSIGWVITAIVRERTKTKRFTIKLSDTAKEAYMEKAIHLGE